MTWLIVLQALFGPIGAQDLPAQGCAAYLWSLSEPPALVAKAEPARLRVHLGGKVTELARATAEGDAGLGLARRTRYASAEAAVTLELQIEQRPDLTKGGLAREGTLTLERSGQDAVVTPVAGMVGCR
jgi:hypothetical protein